MQAVLVGVVLELVVILMILLLFSLVRRMDLMSFQLKDAIRRIESLERKKEPDGPTTGRERAMKS
ncbi:MAG: hypothetical protein ACRDHP_11645 [Ktedonobacterales bacterium]